MNRKEFLEAVDKMTAEVVAQAYASMDNGFNILSCERMQRRFKGIIGNGYIKLGFEGAGGSVGCWWTSALSVKPHEKVLYEYDQNDNHNAVVSCLREYFWSVIHKAAAFAAKRKLSGFVLPDMRDFSEYEVEMPVHDGEESVHRVDGDTASTLSPDSADAIAADDDAFEHETLEDEVLRGMSEEPQDNPDEVESLDEPGEEEPVKKPRKLFGHGRKDKNKNELPAGNYPDLDALLENRQRAYEEGLIDSDGQEAADE